MSQKFIKQFFIGSGILLVLCALAVVIFDPFFQYHKPMPGLKEILTEKEYQVPGTLKNFEYDAVIAVFRSRRLDAIAQGPSGADPSS